MSKEKTFAWNWLDAWSAECNRTCKRKTELARTCWRPNLTGIGVVFSNAYRYSYSSDFKNGSINTRPFEIRDNISFIIIQYIIYHSYKLPYSILSIFHIWYDVDIDQVTFSTASLAWLAFTYQNCQKQSKTSPKAFKSIPTDSAEVNSVMIVSHIQLYHLSLVTCC